MNTHFSFEFSELPTADLVVDAIYRGGAAKNASADPLAALLPVGNQGGFRTAGGRRIPGCRLAVIFSNLAEPSWPDHLDLETGRLTYYGDNRKPGHQLHDTPRGGNELLRACFDALHASVPRRAEIPPFIIFTGMGTGRDIRFRGLAVPGASGLSATDDLVAVWKTAGTERFQNYRAQFTILDVPVVRRAWLTDVLAGKSAGGNAPAAFQKWVQLGHYTALVAERTVRWRTKTQQLPDGAIGVDVITRIHTHFSSNPYEFEKCAALLAQWMDPNIVSIDVTRPWMDGGRDAVGHYRIGTEADNIKVEFAPEAKCYAINNANGVKHTSRLISRLRYRQFGIFVTTSYLDDQAYQEVRADGHPVIVISGGDIVRLLASKGLSTVQAVSDWLQREFPLDNSQPSQPNDLLKTVILPYTGN